MTEDAAFLSDEHSVIGALSYGQIVKLNEAGKFPAPSVLKAIDDYRAGQRLPLTAVQSWHVDAHSSIIVEKGH